MLGMLLLVLLANNFSLGAAAFRRERLLASFLLISSLYT
jgi:hypothetical protein